MNAAPGSNVGPPPAGRPCIRERSSLQLSLSVYPASRPPWLARPLPSSACCCWAPPPRVRARGWPAGRFLALPAIKIGHEGRAGGLGSALDGRGGPFRRRQTCGGAALAPHAVMPLGVWRTALRSLLPACLSRWPARRLLPPRPPPPPSRHNKRRPRARPHSCFPQPYPPTPGPPAPAPRRSLLQDQGSSAEASGTASASGEGSQASAQGNATASGQGASASAVASAISQGGSAAAQAVARAATTNPQAAASAWGCTAGGPGTALQLLPMAPRAPAPHAHACPLNPAVSPTPACPLAHPCRRHRPGGDPGSGLQRRQRALAPGCLPRARRALGRPGLRLALPHD